MTRCGYFPELSSLRFTGTGWIMQPMSDLYPGCLNWRPYKFFIHSVHCKRILRGCSRLRSVIVFCSLSAWSQVWSASSSSTGRMSQPTSMMRWLWSLSPSRSSLRRRISQNPREAAWATPTSGKQGRSLNGESDASFQLVISPDIYNLQSAVAIQLLWQTGV